MKAQPVDQAQQIHTNKLATLYRWIANWWHRGQIGHRSEYSVERLLAFRDYYKRTSFARVVAVCILTPFPAITVALLIDCTPLRSPSEGWQANYAFWIRWFLALVAVSVGATAQIREVILPEAISNAEAVVISLGTAITDLSVALSLAVTWRFPIPFGYILMVGPYVLILLGFTLMVIGRRLLTESSVLRQQIKSQVAIIVAQGAVAMVYPFFTAVFTQLSGPQQTLFVIVTPLFKHITKHIIANAAQGLHEYVGPIVVFSVDVFSVFYVASCMQISKTMITTLFIIASDSFHVVVALRIIFRQANVFESSREERSSSTMNYLDDLPEMLQHFFVDPMAASHGYRFRVSAPFPLPLSIESSSFMSIIARNRETSAGPGVQLTEVKSFRKKIGMSKQHHLSQSSKTSTLHSGVQGKKSPRKGSAPRRLLTLMHSDAATSANQLRSALLEEATNSTAPNMIILITSCCNFSGVEDAVWG